MSGFMTTRTMLTKTCNVVRISRCMICLRTVCVEKITPNFHKTYSDYTCEPNESQQVQHLLCCNSATRTYMQGQLIAPSKFVEQRAQLKLSA